MTFNRSQAKHTIINCNQTKLIITRNLSAKHKQAKGEWISIEIVQFANLLDGMFKKQCVHWPFNQSEFQRDVSEESSLTFNNNQSSLCAAVVRGIYYIIEVHQIFDGTFITVKNHSKLMNHNKNAMRGYSMRTFFSSIFAVSNTRINFIWIRFYLISLTREFCKSCCDFILYRLLELQYMIRSD